MQSGASQLMAIGVAVFLLLSAVLWAEEIDVSQILDEVAKVKEELLRERTKLITDPSRNREVLSKQLTDIQDQLEVVERIETAVARYRKKLEEGESSKLSFPEVELGDLSKAVSSVINGDANPDVAYAGKEGVVLRYETEKGAVMVYGRVVARVYYDGHGNRQEEDEMIPEWGVFIPYTTFLLTFQENGECLYGETAVYITPRKVCPISLLVVGSGKTRTDGDRIYTTLLMEVVDPSFEHSKISTREVSAVLSPEGSATYIGTWENRFPVYTTPRMELNPYQVYMDKDKIEFVNELIRMRMGEGKER